MPITCSQPLATAIAREQFDAAKEMLTSAALGVLHGDVAPEAVADAVRAHALARRQLADKAMQEQLTR